MNYKSYDELISLVTDFRLEHQNLSVDELDRLVKSTFRIDSSILRELDGTTDLMTTPLQNTPSTL
jgi:hypothetical protein